MMGALLQSRPRRRSDRGTSAGARGPDTPSPISILLVDDRRAASYSLWALLNWQRDLHVIATAQSSAEARTLTMRHRPDVCLVSIELGPAGALRLIDRLKALENPPRVLLYADATDTGMAAAALVAHADGLVWRYADPATLAAAIKDIVVGRERFPAFEPDAPQRLADQVADGDRAIASMLVLRTPRDDIARILGISARKVDARRQNILGQLDRAITNVHPEVGHVKTVATQPDQHLFTPAS